MSVPVKLSLKAVADAIEGFDQQEQQLLLSRLLSLLKISTEDLALLKVAEPSFDFCLKMAIGFFRLKNG